MIVLRMDFHCLLMKNGKRIAMNFSSIPKVVSKCNGNGYWNSKYPGLNCNSERAFLEITNSTEITSLTTYCSFMSYTMYGSIDLSNMTALRSFSSVYFYKNVILPESCISLSMRASGIPYLCSEVLYKTIYLDFNECRTGDHGLAQALVDGFGKSGKIETLELSGLMDFSDNSLFYETVEGISTKKWDGSNVDILKLNGSYSYGGFGSFDQYAGFENLTGLEYLEIKNFTRAYTTHFWSSLAGLKYLDMWNNSVLKSSEGFDQMTSLKFLNLKKNSLLNIDGIVGLTNLCALDLSENKISSLKGIDNMKNLGSAYVNRLGQYASGYLNLNNNLISDTSSYIDENGDTIGFNNLELLAKLNPGSGLGGHLTRLYIAGNKDILNYAPLKASNLSWDNKSGF